MIPTVSLFLVVTLLLCGSCYCTKYQRTVRYHDEIVIRCPVNVDLVGIKEFLQRDDVDIWKVSDGTVDVRIHKGLLSEKEGNAVITKCTTIANVETLVQQFENITSTSKVKQQEWFEEYHRYAEIVVWYEELATRCTNCKYVPSIGLSYEEREQPAFHIGEEGTGKLKIYFQCQNHAREWISGATCMYIANYLVENAENDRVKRLLDELEFIFVPFVNPDGYEYTHTTDRLWRKNRQASPQGSNCEGVDLNRNYNDHWSEGDGSSPNPCSETYHGTGAASEPETQNTQNYFKSNTPIIGAIDWHSYSQLILRPYGWTSADSPDEARLSALGSAVSNAIFEVHGKTYTSQKAIGLYPTSGTARDWFYGDDATNSNDGYRAAGYTFELRDTGQYGFLLPPDQIIPTGEENVAGALEFAENLLNDPIYAPNSHH